MTQPNEMIERMAAVVARSYGGSLCPELGVPGDYPVDRVDYTAARGVLHALFDPTEEMWGGLARDIVMWMDMSPKTPRALFKHLECSGRVIPDWLRNEPEMQALDHVPSKGTRAVLIWKAVIWQLAQDAFAATVPDTDDHILTEREG